MLVMPFMTSFPHFTRADARPEEEEEEDKLLFRSGDEGGGERGWEGWRLACAHSLSYTLEINR